MGFLSSSQSNNFSNAKKVDVENLLYYNLGRRITGKLTKLSKTYCYGIFYADFSAQMSKLPFQIQVSLGFS